MMYICNAFEDILASISSFLPCFTFHACACVQLFVTLWTAAHQAPLSMGFSKQESRSGLHALLQDIFAVHLKLTQHCKSTILQFFKKERKKKKILVQLNLEVQNLPIPLASLVLSPVHSTWFYFQPSHDNNGPVNFRPSCPQIQVQQEIKHLFPEVST